MAYGQILCEILPPPYKMRSSGSEISGDIIYIGCGEPDGFRAIAKTAKMCAQKTLTFTITLSSRNAEDVSEGLDRGLLDFGILIEPADIRKYGFIKLPAKDRWGSGYERIILWHHDLQDIPLLVSRQSLVHDELSSWLVKPNQKLLIFPSYPEISVQMRLPEFAAEGTEPRYSARW